MVYVGNKCDSVCIRRSCGSPKVLRKTGLGLERRTFLTCMDLGYDYAHRPIGLNSWSSQTLREA